jgi:hypothetical protein
MRRREYLSPTAVKQYYDDTEAFYKIYLSDNRPPRFPQTQPMAVGSAFDAYIKSYLYEALVGKGDARFSFETLFEAQVEPHVRDWARIAGRYCFNIYRDCGALADILADLEGAVGDPIFEIELRGPVSDGKTTVELLGKPDILFMNSEGHPVILDWKVNGYCSKSAVSPMKGFVRIRNNARGNAPHKEASVQKYRGCSINVAHYLESLNEDWAAQLAMYAWLLGQQIGDETIVGLDQLCCGPTGGEFPTIRVAAHRLRVSGDYQRALWLKVSNCWEIINSDHIFRDLSKQESQARCMALDSLNAGHAELAKSDDPSDKLFLDLCS